jgi:hypothetical protein
MRAFHLLALALFLAGCLSGVKTPDPGAVHPPAAALLCLDEAARTGCNQEATVSPPTRQANELSVAVNPTNPLNVIATGKDYTPEEAGDCVWAGLYATTDGGATWKNQNVPGSPWKRLRNPMIPATDFSKFWCATDPVVAFGPDGTAYWTVMPYQCDAASGSKTGRGTLPNGGFNDWFWTCSAMYVLVSHDGGLTWPEWKEVAFGPRLEHDKQWMATAPDGRVLLCWDRDTNYQLTNADPVADQLTPGTSVIACSVSRDQGKSWTEPASMNPDWAGGTPAVDFDANGTAYAVVVDAAADTTGENSYVGNVLVTTSRDGLDWTSPVKAGTYAVPPQGGEYGWPVLRGSDFRIVEAPSIAVDRGHGPYAGSLYVAWFDHAGGDGNVSVAASRDRGRTWIRLPTPHDDDPAKRADQFYPALSVGPDGTVDVSWWDRRDDPNNHLFHVYYTYSKDGGQTWATNVRVSEEPSDEQYSHHQNGMVFLGDYRDMDSSSLGAHLVWVDTRHQQADVYTATVKR